jgi:putative DeoR family transcriptional regulator (stage III sporulation protein D)
MKKIIEERVQNVAHFILQTHSTVRTASKQFSVSKSTIHKDLNDRLLEIDPLLHKKISDVLLANKMERHINGGIATSLLKLKRNRQEFKIEEIYKINNIKTLICITTNKEFSSIREASRYYKVNASSISKCCREVKHYKSAGKIILDDGTQYKLVWRLLV